MKKSSLILIMLFCGFTAFAQAVKDRNVIPVAVNLNQVLRMTITNGGNIEFVFNTIDDYKNGLSSQAASAAANPATSVNFYKTDFNVASSSRWELTYGSEEATFIGTDDPANTDFTLDNVGFTITNNGGNHFNGTGEISTDPLRTDALISVPTNNALTVAALQVYPTVLITDAGSDAIANAGDSNDNSFTLNWRCGTAEAGTVVPMNDTKLINQNPSPAPDRYVVNVLFELSALAY
jgi:hypothetical protein